MYEMRSISQKFNDKITEGRFGLELEGLRVTKDGKLSLTPHPNKFNNPPYDQYITNDFSESQIEIITPCCSSLNQTYDVLSKLHGIVQKNLNPNEMLWNQSIPCILPSNDEIPIAKFEGNENSEELINYRKNLLKRYDIKKQLISGIHFNFSFDNKLLHEMHRKLNPEKQYNDFKNQMYLKIARNYQRYCWLIIYLTGASVGAHNTFTEESKKLAVVDDENEGFYNPYSCSLRNSTIGYKNIVDLYPRYDNVDSFVKDVMDYIKQGYISNAKELYTQIRLKPYNLESPLESLYNDGINYIEIRTLDINPFDRNGISKDDLQFLHLFMIYMLLLEENDNDEWLKEGINNENLIAELAFHKNTKLKENDRKINVKKSALNHLKNMAEISEDMNNYGIDVIATMKNRIEDPKQTYSQQLISLIKENGFINSQLEAMS